MSALLFIPYKPVIQEVPSGIKFGDQATLSSSGKPEDTRFPFHCFVRVPAGFPVDQIAAVVAVCLHGKLLFKIICRADPERSFFPVGEDINEIVSAYL